MEAGAACRGQFAGESWLARADMSGGGEAGVPPGASGVVRRAGALMDLDE
jgi:hypothetical protein